MKILQDYRGWTIFSRLPIFGAWDISRLILPADAAAVLPAAASSDTKLPAMSMLAAYDSG